MKSWKSCKTLQLQWCAWPTARPGGPARAGLGLNSQLRNSAELSIMFADNGTVPGLMSLEISHVTSPAINQSHASISDMRPRCRDGTTVYPAGLHKPSPFEPGLGKCWYVTRSTPGVLVQPHCCLTCRKRALCRDMLETSAMYRSLAAGYAACPATRHTRQLVHFAQWIPFLPLHGTWWYSFRIFSSALLLYSQHTIRSRGALVVSNITLSR